MAISEREKRALTIAGIAVGLFLAFQYGVFPAWDAWQETTADLPVRERTLLKYRNAAGTTSLRGAERAVLEARLREAETALLTGNTTAIASAELQQLVQQLASEQSIEIRSSEFLPVKPLGADYLEVPLGLQFQCRLDSLVPFLEALAANPKALNVTRWGIHATANKEKLFTVTMTVAGVVRRDAVAQGKNE